MLFPRGENEHDKHTYDDEGTIEQQAYNRYHDNEKYNLSWYWNKHSYYFLPTKITLIYSAKLRQPEKCTVYMPKNDLFDHNFVPLHKII